MTKPRLQLCALICWTAALYAFDKTVAVGWLSAELLAICALLICLQFLSHQVCRFPSIHLGALGTAALHATRWWLGDVPAADSVMFFLVEATAIVVSVVIAKHVAKLITDLEDAGAQLQEILVGPACLDFDEGQREIYRELRRARVTGRPATLVALKIGDRQTPDQVHHFIQDLQQRLLDRYRAAKAARAIAGQLNDCDILVQRHGHLLALLVESDKEQAATTTTKMQAAVHNEIGADLHTFRASFPDHEVTLTGLVDQAEKGLREGIRQRAPQAVSNGRPSAAQSSTGIHGPSVVHNPAPCTN